jgi:hypothetical protein
MKRIVRQFIYPTALAVAAAVLLALMVVASPSLSPAASPELGLLARARNGTFPPGRSDLRDKATGARERVAYGRLYEGNPYRSFPERAKDSRTVASGPQLHLFALDRPGRLFEGVTDSSTWLTDRI